LHFQVFLHFIKIILKTFFYLLDGSSQCQDTQHTDSPYNDTQHNNKNGYTQYKLHSALQHPTPSVDMLTVLMLSVFMLFGIMLSAVMLCAVMVNAIMLNAVMLNAVMLNAIMLNAVMLNAVMLNAVMLFVVAPSSKLQFIFQILFFGFVTFQTF
jgi:hypothetical protein